MNTSYGNTTYGAYGSPTRVNVSVGQMDDQSIYQKIAEIMKVTEVIADQIASVRSNDEAAPLANLTAEDSDELWRVITDGY